MDKALDEIQRLKNAVQEAMRMFGFIMERVRVLEGKLQQHRDPTPSPVGPAEKL